MNYHAEQHLYFELISSLWREREKEEFVSRQELHDELFQRIPDAKNELLTALVHGGIDHNLDTFAFHGYNEAAFLKRLDEDADKMPAESGPFWRYKVERQGVAGYVQHDDLSDSERKEITTQLKLEAQQAIEEGEQLHLVTELLKPYFTTSRTTVGEAWAAMKARLEAGDRAEQARYEGFMLRGLKQRFLQ